MTKNRETLDEFKDRHRGMRKARTKSSGTKAERQSDIEHLEGTKKIKDNLAKEGESEGLTKARKKIIERKPAEDAVAREAEVMDEEDLEEIKRLKEQLKKAYENNV